MTQDRHEIAAGRIVLLSFDDHKRRAAPDWSAEDQGLFFAARTSSQ
jgi:hypothetical protein